MTSDRSGNLDSVTMPNPANVVPAMIAEVLAVAQAWTNWNGKPVTSDGRTMTPHKAIRRVVDHTIDHLAEAVARINNTEPLDDHWHNSANTTPADLAPFTANDLNEAVERLNRLAQLWRLTYAQLDDATLDAPIPNSVTLRELAHHAAESIDYANMIGKL
jgi:HAMP domain-containing protein